jgi:cytochrome bd-type quinol oxidase subunit 2
MSGIDWAFRMVQTANFLILAGWLVLAILALTRLRRCQLDETARVPWVIIIVLVPFMGGLAFFIVRPGNSRWGKRWR